VGAIALWMGVALAQDTSSGAGANAYALPQHFEPVLNLRTYFLETENGTGVTGEAWALGGSAGLRGHRSRD